MFYTLYIIIEVVKRLLIPSYRVLWAEPSRKMQLDLDLSLGVVSQWCKCSTIFLTEISQNVSIMILHN